MREKQIEEMAKAMCGNGMSNGNCATDDKPCELECVYGCCAERLYSKGYRKQSEGEWIFKEEKDAFFCSLCDNEALIDASFIGIDFAIAELSDFCPHCGAKMKGGAE